MSDSTINSAQFDSVLKRLERLERSSAMSEFPAGVASLTWHPSRPLLATLCKDGSVFILEFSPDLNYLESTFSATTHEDNARNAITWSKCGHYWRVGDDIRSLRGIRSTNGAFLQWSEKAHVSYDGQWTAALAGNTLLVTKRTRGIRIPVISEKTIGQIGAVDAVDLEKVLIAKAWEIEDAVCIGTCGRTSLSHRDTDREKLPINWRLPLYATPNQVRDMAKETDQTRYTLFKESVKNMVIEIHANVFIMKRGALILIKNRWSEFPEMIRMFLTEGSNIIYVTWFPSRSYGWGALIDYIGEDEAHEERGMCWDRDAEAMCISLAKYNMRLIVDDTISLEKSKPVDPPRLYWSRHNGQSA